MDALVNHETTMRPYRKSDIEALCIIAREEIPKLPNYKNIVVIDKKVRFLFENNIDNAKFLCLVLCDSHQGNIVGGVVGYCGESLFSFDPICQDQFLWIDPEYRTLKNARKLINGFLEWAKARKPQLILASHTGGLKSEKMDAMLQRQGFVPVGTLYQYRRNER